jgi:hypothetical protein
MKAYERNIEFARLVTATVKTPFGRRILELRAIIEKTKPLASCRWHPVGGNFGG